jgi:hypothetical protein
MTPIISEDRKPSQPTATFLFCVESGYFEAQTLLAIECLRKFGGRWADAPVLVVTPRFGPSLEDATLRRLDALGARYVRTRSDTRCSWYVYMNKGLAASAGEDLSTTDQVVWLDSDVLVVEEPLPLLLGPEEDFTCCSIDKNVGTSGPDDPYDAYWQALSRHFGVPLEKLPWLMTDHDRQRVRFRLHSGVYAFRRGSGLGRAFASDMESMLSSRICFSRKLPFPGDDVALAYSVVRLNLRWRQLDMACNFEMTPHSKTYSREAAATAKILHYHRALATPAGCDWFLQELQTFRPDVADWLRDRIPLPTKLGGFHRSMLRRLLSETRKRRQRKYEMNCVFHVQA